LADAELELIPQEIRFHPVIQRSGKKRRKSPRQMLLESDLHKSALRKLDGGDRRGRPDIVHFFLLLAMDSILNKKRVLRTLIHTRNDQLISVQPETRIPRNYNRFVGLIEDLFQRRAVPPEEPLLTHVAVIIGGFPEGDFISPAEDIADRSVSIFSEELTVWTVTSEVLARFEGR
jgi:rRNA small subunit pseudouridine methyltransferase Nep1